MAQGVEKSVALLVCKVNLGFAKFCKVNLGFGKFSHALRIALFFLF